MPAPALTSEAIVSQWIAAFNERDLDATLSFLDPDVELHPLRLAGLQRAYHGHDGVRRWFTQLALQRHDHRIVVTAVHATSLQQVLVAGTLSVSGGNDAAPFCGQHRLANGLIVAAHHYMSDPDTLEYLGLTA